MSSEDSLAEQLFGAEIGEPVDTSPEGKARSIVARWVIDQMPDVSFTTADITVAAVENNVRYRVTLRGTREGSPQTVSMFVNVVNGTFTGIDVKPKYSSLPPHALQDEAHE